MYIRPALFFFLNKNQTRLFSGSLLYVPLSDKYRLGGSALAQCFEQVGDVVPDLDDPALFSAIFNTIQELLDGKFSAVDVFVFNVLASFVSLLV
jgi:phosphoribosylformylglycinamidine (FGAM) synthase-like enzyme